MSVLSKISYSFFIVALIGFILVKIHGHHLRSKYDEFDAQLKQQESSDANDTAKLQLLTEEYRLLQDDLSTIPIYINIVDFLAGLGVVLLVIHFIRKPAKQSDI